MCLLRLSRGWWRIYSTIFQTKKTNLPKKKYHSTPKLLNWIHSSIVSNQSRATRSKKQFHSNLTSDEHVAKQELNKLQNDRIITIKPCDKGCWVIVLNFCDYHYLDSCLKHLRCSEEIIQHPGQFLAGHSRYAQKSRRTKWWKFYWRGWHLCS